MDVFLRVRVFRSNPPVGQLKKKKDKSGIVANKSYGAEKGDACQKKMLKKNLSLESTVAPE